MMQLKPLSACAGKLQYSNAWHSPCQYAPPALLGACPLTGPPLRRSHTQHQGPGQSA
jgi:hypothetical protein